MQVKQVVTSFIHSEGKIIILRRSQKVGTHPQKWAGVSGYLEKKEEPLTRALREIEEETSLTQGMLKLIKTSEPIGIPDSEADIFWVIYPHLFNTQKSEIKTDWEHTEYRWIYPRDLPKYDVVPGLNETLQKVLPTPIENITRSREVIESVKMIDIDGAHSASWLALKAVKTLVQASEAYDTEMPYDYLTHLKMIAQYLMNIRPSMASIHSQVGDLLYRIVEKSKHTTTQEEIKQFVKRESDFFSRESEEDAEAIAENVSKLIPTNSRILTHSYSYIVVKALKLAHDSKKDIHVFVTESRPLFEGRAAAKELSEYGIPTTLIIDAAAGFFAGKVRLLLIGADSLLADGSVINKVGTYPLALAAAHQGVPLYVATELNKVNLRSYFTQILLEEKVSTEVWPERPDTVAIRNLYFDITPKFFIREIITEKGKIRPDEILRICEEIIKYRYIV